MQLQYRVNPILHSDFKITAMGKFGFGQGFMVKALREAMDAWIKENEEHYNGFKEKLNRGI